MHFIISHRKYTNGIDSIIVIIIKIDFCGCNNPGGSGQPHSCEKKNSKFPFLLLTARRSYSLNYRRFDLSGVAVPPHLQEWVRLDPASFDVDRLGQGRTVTFLL